MLGALSWPREFTAIDADVRVYKGECCRPQTYRLAVAQAMKVHLLKELHPRATGRSAAKLLLQLLGISITRLAG